MKFKELVESAVGQVGRTSVKDAMTHISPELEKEFFKLVKLMGGKTVASVLLNKISIAPVGTSDSVLKRYQDNNFIDSSKCQVKLKNSTQNSISESADAEGLLIKNNIKIKSKFSTKFGTEFVLFKTPDEDEIRKILKDYRVTFYGNSIFVSK